MLIFVLFDFGVDFTANFTNLGASGRLGPSSIGNHYKGQGHDGHVTLVAGIQQWRLPCNTRYRIEAVGATGGYDTRNAGKYRGFGARIIGTFELSLYHGFPSLHLHLFLES